MTVLFTIFAVIAALLGTAVLAALLIKVRIVFEIKKNQGEAFEKTIRMTFFGERLGFDLLKSSKDKPKKEAEKSDEKLLDRIKDFIETIAVLKEVYNQNRFFIRNRLELENAVVFLKFGLTDAASTGIAVGAVWTLLYQLLAFLSCIGTVRDHEFDVVPVYNEAGFCVNAKGIISFRLINIIVVVKRLILTYREISKKHK